MVEKEGCNSSSESRGAINASMGGWTSAVNVKAAELIPAVPAKMSAIRPMQNPQSNAAERDVPMGRVMTTSVHNSGAP